MAYEATLYTFALSVGTAAYVYVCVRPFAHAATRLLAALPALTACVLAPVFYRQAGYLSASMVVGAIVSWWMTSKTVGFALGRGPLALIPGLEPSSSIVRNVTTHMELRTDPAHATTAGKSGHPSGSWRHVTQFLVLALLPVVYAHDGSNMAQHKQQTSAPERANSLAANGVRGLAKLALFVSLAYIATNWTISKEVLRLMFALMVYLSASMMMDGPAPIALLFGIRLKEHFNEPYLSASIREFWAQRWNITAGTTLRWSVYEAIVDAVSGRPISRMPADHHADTHMRAAHRPGKLAMVVGVFAVFLVSGAVHEALIWLVSGDLTGEWLAYFVVHAVLVIAESLILGRWHKELCERSAAVRWISRLYAVGTILLTADWLFWPPTERTSLADKLLREWAQIPVLLAGLLTAWLPASS